MASWLFLNIYICIWQFCFNKTKQHCRNYKTPKHLDINTCVYTKYTVHVSPPPTGIWYCYWEYSSLTGKPGANVTISDIGFQTDPSVYLHLSQTWLIFSMLSSALAVIFSHEITVLSFCSWSSTANQLLFKDEALCFLYWTIPVPYILQYFSLYDIILLSVFQWFYFQSPRP